MKGLHLQNKKEATSKIEIDVIFRAYFAKTLATSINCMLGKHGKI
jgi:hypothetical protein